MKRGLRTHYTLQITGVIILISVLLSVFLLYLSSQSHRNVTYSATQVISQSLYESELQRGKQITSFLSASLTNIYYYSNSEAIYELLKVTGRQTGIKEILVYDHNGNIVHDGDQSMPRYGQSINNPHALSVLKSPGTELSWEQEGDLNFASPIRLGDEILGGVLVSMSTEALQNSLLEMNREMDSVHQSGIKHTILLVVLATAGLVLLGVVISHSVAGAIIAPIRRLADHAIELGQGNFDHRISEDRDDELGDLMAAFEAMRNHLSTSQRQLVKARDSAEDANKAKSQFLAGISHEIRTPMNGVIGCLDLLRDAQLDIQQTSYLQTAISSAQLQLTLINDILDFSKIEAKQIALDNSPFNLRDLLCDIQLLFEGVAKEKQLHLVLNADTDIPNRILGDAVRLKQILMNLVANALKFTDNGSVILTGKMTEHYEHSVRFNFSVEDTGIGIAPERQENIFRAFIQADSSTTKKYGGTGLGLTIAMQLTEMMGGSLTLSSQLGEGSKFQFSLTFPILREKLESTIIEPEESDVFASKRYQLHVLLAEDNQVNSQVGRAMIEKLGCSTDIAENGLIAVAMFKKTHYDMIFMDCDMPQLDGFEATRIIREWERGSTPSQPAPIIALTAHAAVEAKVQCLDAGMSDFLSKPYTRNQLSKMIERWS